jgi:NAD(P)-dependent dehydrogenase (short-subunit alcohol dehydrogenase family)
VDDRPLEGRVSIVTGAGGGIGAAYARGLAAAGSSVVVADIDISAGETVVSRLSAEGHQAIAVAADVTSEASCASMVEAATDTFGGVDVLVNNAALMAEIPAADGLSGIALDMFDRVVAVNLRGPLLCTRAVLSSMRERGGGRIVNQSSGGAWFPGGVYSMTKIGLVSMTASLAHELAPLGIRVNAIAPGSVETAAGLRASASSPGFREFIEATVPFPFGQPEDLLGALLFLVTPGSDWVTGQTINVDGGWIHRI